jgi:toxin ParE1/3/4
MNFGPEQADRYEKSLRQAIDVIAGNPSLAAERREYDPPVRVHHHAKHYIIYLVEAAHILIVRVLRDEVDLTKHL